jgi:predicted RNase H-like nuclease (RuvC/YqgF family)
MYIELIFKINTYLQGGKVGKSFKSYNKTHFPEEREGNAKDSNKKLKAEIKNLKKIIKNLESQNKTLTRSFNKSCDFINEKIQDKNVEEVVKIIDNYEYKETEKGREKQKNKKENINNNTKKEEECPECFEPESKGFKIINFDTFKVHTCICGYRTRVNKKNEGIKGS